MNTVDSSVFRPLRVFVDNLMRFLPGLLTAILILVLGIALGILLKVLALRVLRLAGLDTLAERLGIAQSLKKAGIRDTFSVLVANFIGGLVIVIFAIASFLALNIPTSARILEQFLLYLPNVFVAIAILIIGYAVGNFIGRAVLIASVNAGLKMAGMLARLARLGTFIIALTMSLEQLGVAKETLTIAFAISFGGIVLALSLALGLGGQGMAKKFLEKRFEEDKDESNIDHI